MAQSTIGQRLNRVFNKKPNELKARALGQKVKKKFAAKEAERAAKAKPNITGPSDDNTSGPKVTTGSGGPKKPRTPSSGAEAAVTPPSKKIDKKKPADTSKTPNVNPDLLRRMQMGAAGEDSNTSSTEVVPKKPRTNKVEPDRPSSQPELMPRKGDRLDAKTGERIYTGPGRPKGRKNKPKSKGTTTQITPPKNTNTNKNKNEQGIGSKVADGAKKVVSNVTNAAKDKAQEVASNVKNAAKDKAKEVVSNVVTSAKNKTKELVASGKKKRDEKRAKVTTNYTKPKKGEEMTVPQKKDKVTVNTSKDTAKDREKQKKQAPQALAQAVARRSEADAAKDAVKDMKQSGQKAYLKMASIKNAKAIGIGFKKTWNHTNSSFHALD